MKIGILTLPLHTNYGGNLQAYALISHLKSLGHEPYLIQRRMNKPNYLRLLYSDLKQFIKKLVFLKLSEFTSSIKRELKEGKIYNTISVNTEKFIQKSIQPQTYHVYDSASLEKLVSDYAFDALIVGSDQVWRPNYTPNIYDYFFDFIKDNEHIRKISYAASFGVDHWTFTEKQTRKCQTLLKQFDAVSVRESSGVDLCRQYLASAAEHMVDPTMLVTAASYKQLLQVEYGLDTTSNSGLITYVLDESDDFNKLVNHIETVTGKKHKKVNSKTTSKSATTAERVAPSVESWLLSFACADFIISDSFHACVFSIIFNKPFIALGNKGRGMARFNSLMTMFDLEDRLLFEFDTHAISKILNSNIDWVKVNAILSKQQTRSNTFLQNALS